MEDTNRSSGSLNLVAQEFTHLQDFLYMETALPVYSAWNLLIRSSSGPAVFVLCREVVLFQRWFSLLSMYTRVLSACVLCWEVCPLSECPLSEVSPYSFSDFKIQQVHWTFFPHPGSTPTCTQTVRYVSAYWAPGMVVTPQRSGTPPTPTCSRSCCPYRGWYSYRTPCSMSLGTRPSRELMKGM